MKKDLVDYAYLSDNLRYADLFNGILFGGEEIVAAQKLKGEDTKLVLSSDKKKKGRYRDVIRKYEGDVSYAVLGVENQEAVDYAMPFRIMEYEAGEYARQVAEIKKTHERMADVSGDEYLCKFKRSDKISPCVTLVLYWGENWDGSKTLKEMMNMENMPEALQAYVNDYPIHLVNVREFEDTDVFKTDLKLVFDFMKQSNDRQGMRELLLGNEEYKKVSRDAYEVMRVHTKLDELDKFMEDNTDEEEEVVNMCQAIREIIEEECALAREKAIKEGTAEGRAEGILLYTYRMVERGRLTVVEALEDLNSTQSESEYIEGMLAAGYKLP